MIERAQLLGAARAERDGLGRMIQFAPPDSWERPSACPGWWNRDVMAHLAAQDTAAAQLLASEPTVELDAYRASLGHEPFTVDGFNDVAVNNRAGLGEREVLVEWGKAADSLLAWASKLDAEAWDAMRVPWLAGEIAVRYLIQSRVVEWWVHGEDMRAGAGMTSRIEQWPIHLTNDLAIRMLPWALSRAGVRAMDDLSVKVRLEGAGYGTWRWGLAPGVVPSPSQKPDAYIDGRAPAFALVAARRVEPETYLDDGNLVLGGDTDLAALVLTHIRAYP